MSTVIPQFSLLTATREEYDAAHRLSDTIRGIATDYTLEEIMTGWIAVRLENGKWDGNLYTDRKSAVRAHKSDPYLWAYVSTKMAATGMSPNEAHVFLTYNRMAYDAGFRLPDPDAVNGGKELIAPVTSTDLGSQIRRLLIAKNIPFRHPIR